MYMYMYMYMYNMSKGIIYILMRHCITIFPLLAGLVLSSVCLGK